MLRINLASKHSGWMLALLLYLAGGLGFFILPQLSRKMYLDENAFILEGALPQISASKTLEPVQNLFPAATADHKVLVQNIRKVSQPLGLEVSEQEFSSSKYGTCVNVHVVVRSNRGNGKESIVLLMPVSHALASSAWQQSPAGRQFVLQVGYAMTAYLSSVTWLAKDFIWLLTDARCGLLESTQAWVDEYSRFGPAKNYSSHFSRAGVIQAAIVVEAQQGSPGRGSIEMAVEGYDGLLPKLDLLYVLKSQAARFIGLPLELPDSEAAWKVALQRAVPVQWREWLSALLSGCQWVARSAGGFPTGAHAAFKAVGVDAITMRIRNKGGSLGAASELRVVHRICLCLESVVRSLNNLLERLHHSSSFYILFSPHSMLSIAHYIALPLMCTLALTIQVVVDMINGPVHDRGVKEGSGDHMIGSWLCAAGVVLLTHVLCVCCGLLMHHTACTTANANAGTRLPSPSLQPIVSTAVMLLAGGAFVLSRRSAVVPQPAARDSGRRLKFVYLSVFLVQILYLLCLNWCAAYVLLLLLTPPAIATSSSSARTPRDKGGATANEPILVDSQCKQPETSRALSPQNKPEEATMHNSEPVGTVSTHRRSGDHSLVGVNPGDPYMVGVGKLACGDEALSKQVRAVASDAATSRLGRGVRGALTICWLLLCCPVTWMVFVAVVWGPAVVVSALCGYTKLGSWVVWGVYCPAWLLSGIVVVSNYGYI